MGSSTLQELKKTDLESHLARRAGYCRYLIGIQQFSSPSFFVGYMLLVSLQASSGSYKMERTAEAQECLEAGSWGAVSLYFDVYRSSVL